MFIPVASEARYHIFGSVSRSLLAAFALPANPIYGGALVFPRDVAPMSRHRAHKWVISLVVATIISMNTKTKPTLIPYSWTRGLNGRPRNASIR